MFNNLKELQTGTSGEITLLLKKISTEKAQTGTVYQRMTVRDNSGQEMVFLRFDNLNDIAAPVVIHANVSCDEYKESMSVKVLSCQPMPESSIAPYMPPSHVDMNGCWKEICAMLKTIKSEGLCQIACKIIAESKKHFLTMPLTPLGCFSRQSGLLEATWKLMKLADTTAGLQGLDHDLMLAGAALYYIGKTDTDDSGYDYTEDDVLLGAGLRAFNKIQMKVHDIMENGTEEEKNRIDKKEIKLLSHIVVSRMKGNKTAIAEAACLKYLDEMLCESDAIAESLKEVPAGTIIANNRLQSRWIVNPTAK